MRVWGSGARCVPAQDSGYQTGIGGVEESHDKGEEENEKMENGRGCCKHLASMKGYHESLPKNNQLDKRIDKQRFFRRMETPEEVSLRIMPKRVVEQDRTD